MTIVKYNNCEFIGHNTTEYWSDRRYLGWEGEIITSIRRYLCQHEYGRGPYLYCAIDDSVMLDLHMQTMQHILYDYVICEILLITLVIRTLSTAMLFIN
jgi:hypothetical protein